MSYQTRLVGQIDTKNEQLEIEIRPEHFYNLETLVGGYGWVGRGIKEIVGNPHINGILSDNDVDSLVLNQEGVQGLDNVEGPEKAIIDLPSNNKALYKEYLFRFLKNKNIKLILEHKADVKYPVVSAASIIAKVTRDNEIEKIKKKIKIDFGSGYMADPKTVNFLEKHYETHENIFRKSWMPYKNIVNKKFQKKLEDFSQFIEKVEHKNKSIIEKLKKLEDFGYKFIPTSTEHEHVRMKGPCTITLYKSGKLLVQGKEEHKKNVERLIKK